MSFEILKSVEVVIGLILTGLTVLTSVFFWVWRRVSAHVRSSISPITAGNAGMERRLEKLETALDQQGRRVGHLETQIALLASKDDVNRVALQLAGVAATSASTDQKVDTLYRAIMDRADRR